ncbi:DUF6076 domain-containing protein [Ligaoa zhengdingensis]|uniref:DUF6076 domain-containing protein n=2 Tax=Ligaoa zhengdingensis TaxID=2763658 RepID=UPI0031BAD665
MAHNVLSLDFWQDTVTYAGSVMPTGTIGCEILNIPDETIARLDAPCMVLSLLLTGIDAKNVDMQLLPKAQEAGKAIIHILHDVPPFSRFERKQFEDFLIQAFSEEAFADLNTYLQFPMGQQTVCNITGEHHLSALLIRAIPVLGHLSYSLRQYKVTLTAFAEFLQKNAEVRTPTGYAATFGQFFKENATLEESNPSWMALTNATVQYVPAIRPGNDEVQLVKRMHFVSFVGMFRADLFEGLCVGHAPRKCAVCGRWFLTTDARHTKYCSGYAPNDKHGRTCRQVGNLRGREQRELAADHPIKRIYTTRFNTITQYLGRGTLDEQTAAVMKKLAKRKMERAIREPSYAQGSYAAEMEQAALLAEAKANLKQ